MVRHGGEFGLDLDRSLASKAYFSARHGAVYDIRLEVVVMMTARFWNGLTTHSTKYQRRGLV